MQESRNTIKKQSYFNNLRIVFSSRNYVVILLTNYSGGIFTAAWIYLNLYFRDIGITYFEIGLADAWAMFLGVFAMMLGGYYADRHIPHRKWMATFNMFFLAIATFLIPQVTDFFGLIIIWTIFGFSQFCQASIDPILFESLPPEQMGTGTSLFTFGGVFSIIGLLIVGFLITPGFVEGLNVFWYAFSIIATINFFSRLFFLEKTQATNNSETVSKGLIPDLLSQYRIGFSVLIATIPLFLVVFLLDVASDTYYNFSRNFFLNETVGMSYIAINVTMIGATILGVIGGLSAGFLLDRTENDAKIMFLVYVLLPFSLILLSNSVSYPKWTNIFPTTELGIILASSAFVAVVIKSGNDAVWRIVAWGAVGRKLPREHTGKVMAILSMSIQLLGVVISPLAGFMYQTGGGQPLLLIAIILNFLILLLLGLGWIRSTRNLNRIEEAPQIVS
jgi:MFS family permease